MADLIPICPLGEATPRQCNIGALTLSENVGLGLVSLAVRRSAPIPDLGLTLPGPGGWCAGPGIAAFWTGHRQWMIEYPGRAMEDVAGDLAMRAPGCSLTEQTDGFVCIEARGPARALVVLLEKLVNLDTDRLGPGSATRTVLHHLSVFVIRRAETELAILGSRSAADSLWRALACAAERLEAVE